MLLLSFMLGVAGLVRGEYSPTDGMNAVYLSRIANCPVPEIANQSCGKSCEYFSADPLTNVSVYVDALEDTRAWIGYQTSSNRIVVTVRGTRNWVNWIEDFDFIPTDYSYCSNCKVHSGFYVVLQGLEYEGLITGIQSLLQATSYSAELFIVGHSLGGAVATLLMAHLYEHNVISANTTRLELYTFGSPRVGNPAFASYVTGLLPHDRQHRLTHHMDPVPHLPPQDIFGYHYLHIPQEVYFPHNSSTGFKLCNDSSTAEDPTCSDGELPLDPKDHIWYLGTCMGCCDDRKPDDNCCKELPK
jgi:hypothetical protein